MTTRSSRGLAQKAWASLLHKGLIGLGQDMYNYLRWRTMLARADSSGPLREDPLSNLELNLREIQDLPEVLRSKPLLVYAEATTRCNLRCFMCRLSFPETTRQTREHMSLELFARLEPLLGQDSRLSLFGLGEPLLNPNFVEMLRIAKERGAFVGLNSNAVLLTERMAAAMVNLEQDLLVVSFSGGTRETYERVITGADYDRVLANIRRLNQLKTERGGGRLPLEQVKPVLQLQFTAMRDNIDGLPEAVRLALGLRCAAMVVMPVTIYDPSLAEQSILRPELRSRVEDAFRAAREAAVAATYPFELQLPPLRCSTVDRGPQTEDGGTRGRGDAGNSEPTTQNPELPEDPGLRTQDSARSTQHAALSTQHVALCYEPWQTFYARDDGTVNTCCYSNRVLGDLKKETALEIWNGDLYRRFRARMRSENKPAECRVCHKLLGGDWYDQRVDDGAFYDEL